MKLCSFALLGFNVEIGCQANTRKRLLAIAPELEYRSRVNVFILVYYTGYSSARYIRPEIHREIVPVGQSQ